jgi:serralysin
MADTIYNVNLLGGSPAAVTIVDDGLGLDWLTITGTHLTATHITLRNTTSGGISTSAWGRYTTDGGTTYLLRVNGLIENVRGSNSADFIVGNEANNVLYGDTGASGAGGDDSIGGEAGNDTIFGGAGQDSLSGAAGNDVLYGNLGADSIFGGAGDDVVTGGAGADSLSGGGSGRDRVSYADSTAAVYIKITHGSTTTGLSGFAAGDQINGFNDVTGSAFSDSIRDTVTGTVAFGYNDNRFYGGAGGDWLFLGGGADRGDGGTGSDNIYGGVGNDTIVGGADGDRLEGGTGADAVYGGTGADTFIFSSASDSTYAVAGRDSIFDFSTADRDKIDLAGIDANPNIADYQSFIWRGAAGFTGTEGELRVVNSGLNTLVLGDINGDGTADFSIVVRGKNDMTASDFILSWPIDS